MEQSLPDVKGRGTTGTTHKGCYEDDNLRTRGAYKEGSLGGIGGIQQQHHHKQQNNMMNMTLKRKGPAVCKSAMRAGRW